VAVTTTKRLKSEVKMRAIRNEVFAANLYVFFFDDLIYFETYTQPLLWF